MDILGLCRFFFCVMINFDVMILFPFLKTSFNVFREMGDQKKEK